MPVTAKLSRKFYETFGDEIANEFVEWFNQVDTTYRTDLRDLNELNFARFDAKLEQRFAEQDAKWERRFAQQDTKWERRFSDVDIRLSQLELKIERVRSELLRWMFLFWVGTVGPLLIAKLL